MPKQENRDVKETQVAAYARAGLANPAHGVEDLPIFHRAADVILPTGRNLG